MLIGRKILVFTKNAFMMCTELPTFRIDRFFPIVERQNCRFDASKFPQMIAKLSQVDSIVNL